jgi:deoxyribodipyrimidine photo-lyase
VEQLRALAAETGATSIHAVRHYEPWHQADQAALARDGLLHLYEGNTLAPPAAVLNGQGERYRVFTPWYRRLLELLPPAEPLPAPERIPAPEAWPQSDSLEAWDLLPRNPDWATGFAGWQPGEKGAWRALRDFLPLLGNYKHDRDLPARPATSRLSPHLHFGEISPRAIWHAIGERHDPGAASLRSEVGWREHAINLLDQLPDYGASNGRPAFDRLPWREGPEAEADFRAWTRGQTGYPVVDAGMRELWQTGWMHNRVRMIAASFLTKHLLIDWRRGERWFWDTLLDADAASNAMNWQYVTGSGVDAPVFSRIMSPRLQSEKFAMADYVRRFVPELAGLSDALIHEAHGPGTGFRTYPEPLIGHEAARARALAAWDSVRGQAKA